MMEQCPWEEIHGFRNKGEFNQFALWIQAQMKEGNAIETPVHQPYYDEHTYEKWYIHLQSGRIWQLISPDDAPFTGGFKVLDQSNKCNWNEVDRFPSHTDFERFSLWVDRQVILGKAKEVTVEQPRFRVDDKPYGEKWYLYLDSGIIWRLLWPDPPFMGAFGPIPPSEAHPKAP